MEDHAYAAGVPGDHMKASPHWGNLLNEVGIDSTDLYHQIIGAVTRGSSEKALCWDEFDFQANSDLVLEDEEKVLKLIRKGMQPLDAIVWVNGQNRPAGLTITKRLKEDDVKVVVDKIYSGFFAWYFSLFTQGRAEGAGSPNFLVSIMGMGADWGQLIRGLSSASVDRFPKEWVKNVDLKLLGDKSRNRLALGAAGHRYLAVLKYLRPEDFKVGSEKAVAFIQGIRLWTQDKVWWDLHPITKDGKVITVTGSLNKMIEDCLARSIKEERLKKLMGSKVLHHIPIEQPANAHWENFEIKNLPPLTEGIF